MSGPHPQPLGLKRKQRVLLKQLSRRRQSPHQLVYWSQIIILIALTAALFLPPLH